MRGIDKEDLKAAKVGFQCCGVCSMRKEHVYRLKSEKLRSPYISKPCLYTVEAHRRTKRTTLNGDPHTFPLNPIAHT